MQLIFEKNNYNALHRNRVLTVFRAQALINLIIISELQRNFFKWQISLIDITNVKLTALTAAATSDDV